MSEGIFSGFFKKKESKPKPVSVVPRPAGTGRTTSVIQSEEFSKPTTERNASLIRDVNDAISVGNTINTEIAQNAKISKLKTNNLQAEPVLDKEGNIVGMRVTN